MRLEEAIRGRIERDPEFARPWAEREPSRAFQQALVAARIEAGMTQIELARAASVPRSTVTRLESGEGNPTIATLQKLAGALNVQFQIDAAGISTEREPAYTE
jgi:transcriptional regulator with XRE-family HTH domain